MILAINPRANLVTTSSYTFNFGWQILSDKNDIHQTAYQIELYSELSPDKKIWDSGKVISNQSQGVKPEFDKLVKPGIKYQWRVRVWDNNDNVSNWSEMCYFRYPPKNIENNANWIGAIRRENSNIPTGRTYHGLSISSEAGKKWQETHPLSKRSIYLRREFNNDKKVKDAIIYISGLGHYELTLNGEKLGESQFDPMWSDYDKTIYYNSFDVTNLLEDNNAIGVLLGNGFYNQQGGRYVKMQVSFGPPTLFFKMNITYEDGTIKEIVSDKSWKYSLSPIVFNDMYGGEDYDARLEQKGWDNYNFDDSHWMPVVVQEAPKGKLTPQTTYPIKSMEKFPAESVKRVSNSYVYDMGQNLSGFPNIKVKGNKGDKIRLILGENIYEDGSVNQSQSGSPYYFEYILKGGEEEIWQPRFSFYGYRYIQVDGAKPPKDSEISVNINDERDIPEILNIESLFVYNSNPQTSTFNCSNEIFNNTHRLIVNAMKSNMQAVFTDCPHREKLGWLEQVHLNGPGLFYNFDLTTFAPKIMQDIRDSQLPNGLVPDIAPEYVIFEGGFRDSPEWGSTSVILPFMYYQFYGDNSLIIEYYDVMKRYVDYLTSTADNHIVSHGLGDWCDYREDKPYGVSHNTPVPLSATTHYYMVVDYLLQAAEITGNEEDIIHYTKLRSNVKDAFNKKFFDVDNMYYGTGSQASNAMPLFAGLVDSQNREAVLNNLVKNIEERGFRLSTGDVGNRYLFQTLADNGLNEIMYKMHNHEEVPGYGFQLQFGATTLTELWDPRAGASWNHFMMGQIEEWFFKSLAGIRSEENSGFKEIIIAPKPVGDLKFVEASYETLYGKIMVDWKKQDGVFTLNVSVPVNCTAKIYMPNETGYKTVGSGNYTFTE
ncbi:MAG TPA: glycoside hydrolase family 78 protein [Fermentimonas sp.]|nr:glycoside hydrolase family 78 protein [Fermentimonas sp.]